MPAGASSNWWADVQEEIQRSEYNVTMQKQTRLPVIEEAFQAPNRAHNLRTYFTPRGIRVIPRTSETPEWTWGLSLTAYGFKGNTLPVEEGKMSVSGNRIEYRRQGIREWYVNDHRGLEQGFTLDAPPASLNPDPDSRLVFEMALLGGLKPAINSQGDSIEFATTSGANVVRYSELHVFDATGRELPARFDLSASGVPASLRETGSSLRCEQHLKSSIFIVVDSRNAVFPVTVDPLATSPNWTAESDQAGARFASVSTAGDVNGDGYSDVIIGADSYDNGEADEGRAFVYYGSSSGLNPTPAWTAESNQANTLFGYSVSTAGDVNNDGYSDIIVGAPYYDNGEINEGRAFVYHGSAPA